MTDPLRPSLALLLKLGSIAVHADEMLGSDGHNFDRMSILHLLQDAEVEEWIRQMDVMGYLPKKRT